MCIYMVGGSRAPAPPPWVWGGPPQVMVDAPPPVVWVWGWHKPPPPLWGGCGLFTLHLR